MELNEGFQLKKQKNVEIQEPWTPTTPEKTTTTIIQKNKSPCELACQYGSSGLGSLPGLLASSGQATSGSIVMLHTPATTSNNSSLMGPLSPQVFGNKNGAYSVSGLNKVLMRIGNGLEMPTKSNILVFNAKSFLIASPSNSSYSSNQPDRLPVTSLPNLNSVPKCPVGVSMAVITPAPSTPAIIENCSLNMKDNQIPLELAKKVIVFGSKFVEVENSSTKRENDGIDWNETPTKKPRRKKHRPKVIIDGKPSRILRDGTPLPETPEQGNLEERRSYKRTYVRKKKDAPASSSLNALVKNDVNRTSARRCLKFDSAEKCTLNECSTEMTMFEVAEARARVLCNDRTAASSSMKETVHSCELYEKVMENSVVPIVTDLSTAYQSENECHKMFSAPIMSTEVNKSFGTSEKQMTSLKFSRKKLKELAREKACTDSVGFNVVSFSEAAQNSLNSSSISNPKHKGTIRDQHVTGKHQNSAETSFKRSYNLQGCLQKTHNATKLDSILPVKRKRTKLKKMSHSEATSEFSPKCGRIAKGWKLLRLSDTVLKFTFTDAQSFMTKDTMLASEKMLSFKYKPELHGNHAIGSNSLAYSTKPSMQNNMGFLQPSTPKTLPNFSKYLENRDVNEAHLMVSNISDGHEKAKKRDRKSKIRSIHARSLLQE
ncbi:hypothetical protein HPP92_026211 [Vanilla planifolia]|uniref:Uncharacterized protein n=1 Tax=Vanilla planifolia TaxID=51239 RepID=A0A835UA79_VANPL|nr:hypothetical protein HPP92_026211 [Vanilla planifolia]